MGNTNTYRIFYNGNYPFKVQIEQSIFGDYKVSVYLGKKE